MKPLTDIRRHMNLREKAWDDYFYWLREHETHTDGTYRFKCLESVEKAAEEARHQDELVSRHYTKTKLFDKIDTINGIVKSGRYGGEITKI